jgi:D-alanyl-D-alanine carboxypeptidase
MTALRGGRRVAFALALALAALAGLAAPERGAAAPYAALVMDARTGEVLHSRSADRRLHPASLTKMMTMYLAIEAVKQGRLRLDQRVTVSARAARQPPSKIGLRTGQRVTVRHLMRATAVKSANDAATALAEATAGSVENWSRMAIARARILGMTRTTLLNPHGLTQSGHLSTARDMAILGRRLFFDFPEYYNLFSRKHAVAMGRTIRATNRRLLSEYPGADGIKTGYTRAAGFNLVASARRGNEHVIAALFGGRSSADRNRRIKELLDMGFARAPSTAPVIPPAEALGPVMASAVPLARPQAPRTLLARVGAAIGPSAAAAATRTPPAPATRHAPRRAELPRPRPGGDAIGVAMELPPDRP